jgi:hypothetical protein
MISLTVKNFEFDTVQYIAPRQVSMDENWVVQLNVKHISPRLNHSGFGVFESDRGLKWETPNPMVDRNCTHCIRRRE